MSLNRLQATADPLSDVAANYQERDDREPNSLCLKEPRLGGGGVRNLGLELTM